MARNYCPCVHLLLFYLHVQTVLDVEAEKSGLKSQIEGLNLTVKEHSSSITKRDRKIRLNARCLLNFSVSWTSTTRNTLFTEDCKRKNESKQRKSVR